MAVPAKTTVLKNSGAADLRITGMEFSIDGLTLKTKQVISPGEEANLTIELDTASLSGEIRGRAILVTNDPQSPNLTLQIKAHVESQIEIKPRPTVFMSAFRWEVQEKEASLFIENKDQTPLQIVDVRTDSNQFTPKVETIQEGSRYKLVVKMTPAAQGRSQGWLTIQTNVERLEIPVYTFLKEKVYLNPNVVEFGRIDVKDIEKDPTLLNFLKQSVFIYQHGGKNFQIQIQVPDSLKVERTPPEGPGAVITIPRQGETSVFELVIFPNKEKLQKGELRETIRVSTNDPDFPTLEIPVTGVVM